MTLPKKGARTIVVNGEIYRWMIRRKPSYFQAVFASELSFAVEHASSPGTTLLVLTNHARPDNLVGGEFSLISPSMVASSIERAIQQGWNSTKAGSTYTLEIETQPLVINAQAAKSSGLRLSFAKEPERTSPLVCRGTGVKCRRSFA